MARKERKRGGTEAELDINMTPMIDVVFNLIIFFMVITDMTQKDLEYLILPKADKAAKDEGKDTERIIINIIDFDSKENAPRVGKPMSQGGLDPKLPPIMMGGRQVQSLEEMRELLRQQADPYRFPDIAEFKKLGKPPLPYKWNDGKSVYPSKKPVLVRCDRGQVFGWVQAIMQYCTFVPGEDIPSLIKRSKGGSPLIYKLEIAVKEPDAGQD